MKDPNNPCLFCTTINNDIIEENKFELVETFAEKIAEMVIKDFDVNWIKLRVSKPGALRFSKDVGVIIERTSEDYE